jgi:hypothetical protein
MSKSQKHPKFEFLTDIGGAPLNRKLCKTYLRNIERNKLKIVFCALHNPISMKSVATHFCLG